VKLVDAPGASAAVVKTGVIPLWLLRTTTLVSRMLPALLMEPLKTSKPPGDTVTSGQFSVIIIRGVTPTGQIRLAWLVAPTPQELSAVTVETLALEQLVGAR